MRYDPTGKNLVLGLCGKAGPISGASARDSAWSINFNPNRSAAAGSSRAIYLMICSRSFLLRAEKTTSQAMSGRPGEVGPHCKFAPGRCPAPLHRVMRLVRHAQLRSTHPIRIAARAIAIPKRPAQPRTTFRSLLRFAQCSRRLEFYRSKAISAILPISASAEATVSLLVTRHAPLVTFLRTNALFSSGDITSQSSRIHNSVNT